MSSSIAIVVVGLVLIGVFIYQESRCTRCHKISRRMVRHTYVNIMEGGSGTEQFCAACWTLLCLEERVQIRRNNHDTRTT